MKDYQKFYRALNAEQRTAVDAIEGPVLVLAGPGTGKTQLLSVRAGSILTKTDARPENMLILTYTNSASKAMKERLSRIIGPAGYDVEVGTFHSFANSIIQESEEAANYAGDKIQMTDVEQMRAIEHILDNTRGLEEIRPFRAPYIYLKEILKRISELKRDGITPDLFDGYLRREKASYAHLDEKHVKRMNALALVYRRYEELKNGRNKDIFDERGRYDFDDMILFAAEALGKERALKKEYQAQYRYVMVDEFQDTNGSQLEMLFTLLDFGDPNIMCVGDDDQSIYRFQGASVGNFKELSRRFPKIKVVYLKDNYRSSKELIDTSRRIISLVPVEERMGEKSLEALKKWQSREITAREFTAAEEELLFIVDKVKALKAGIAADPNLTDEERSHPYNNIAVLVRKRDDILKVIDAFLKAGIPYATDGKEDISGERRVKQLLDILELASIDPNDADLKDLALYRVLAADYFQIPHSDILRFISFVNKKREDKEAGVSLLGELLSRFSSKTGGVDGAIKFERPERLGLAGRAIARLLEDARARPVHAILLDFVKEAGILKYIVKEYSDNSILRIRQLRSLVSFVNMVKTSDLANPGIRLDDFMLEMKTRKGHGLPIRGDLVTLTQDGVRVYTAHGSKGLEFHSVIMPFCLHNKNWPAKPPPDKIQLPFGLFRTRERVKDARTLKELALQDETRLFYVAMTRARSHLIFTASPTEDSVSSPYLGQLDIEREAPEYAAEESLAAKSLDLTDLEDPFIGTEDVLKDMVANMSLNPTRLNTYMACRRKFLYNDLLKLPGPKKKSLVFGNCVHKALEETYREYMDKKRFPPFEFFRGSFRAALKFQGAGKAMERDCLDKMETVRGWFDSISRKPVMPIALERKLIVTVGDNIIFTGKYDKVEWQDEKARLVRIVDYKTGKPDQHVKAIDKEKDLKSKTCDAYLRQLVCYRLLFERDKPQTRLGRVSHGLLVFVEPLSADARRHGYKKGDYVAKAVEIGDDMVAQAEGLIKEVWAGIKSLHFEKLPERDKDLCGTCDFDSICWE